jgi:phage tail-like protein
MATADELDIEHLGSQFSLEIDGIEIGRFTGCSGLAVEFEVVEEKYTDATTGTPRSHKRPGRVKYGDITLKRGLSASKTLTDWTQKVIDGQVEYKTGSIVVYNAADKEVDRWNFENAWPSKWSASDLSADSDDVMIEEVTLSNDFFTRA